MTEEYHLRKDQDADYRGGRSLDADIFPTLSCWTVGPAGICVESWQNDRLKIGIYIGGTRVAGATLNADDPCYAIEEGDFIKIKAKICADFGKRNVVAEGYVRVAGQRITFKQIIFRW